MINSELILLPALAMVLLTFIVWIWLFVTRVGEIRKQRIHLQDLATRNGTAAALKNVAAPADNLMNLFELPVLFYFLVALLYASGAADAGYVILGVSYAALRYVHSFIHLTYNRVMDRFLVFALSSIVLWAMWARFAWQAIEWMTLDGRV